MAIFGSGGEMRKTNIQICRGLRIFQIPSIHTRAFMRTGRFIILVGLRTSWIHLPFVHASTIGRGNRRVVDGPITRLQDEELNIWVYNRLDDGIPARRSEELPEPQRPPSLRFLFPNNWMNNISTDFRITISFIPVDDGNTLFCLRNYVKKSAIPGLAKLIALLAIPSSRVILNQDERVVTKQLPIKSDLKIGEILIPQDGPIILYRRLRQELKEISKTS
jgi:phenylpropionate dioxygenase-like ring-hydroxylating dioxygenase large terminal subunit